MSESETSFSTPHVRPYGQFSSGCSRCNSSVIIKPLAGPPEMFPHDDGFAYKLAELAISDDGTILVRPARGLNSRQVSKLWQLGRTLRATGMSAIPTQWAWDQSRGVWTTTLCENA